MRYALHESESPDGRLFEVGHLTQRMVPLAGSRPAGDADEVLYVLEGRGTARLGGASHDLRFDETARVVIIASGLVGLVLRGS